MEIDGRVVNVNLASEGLSSISIQPKGDNPRQQFIVSGPRDAIAELATAESVHLSLVPQKSK